MDLLFASITPAARSGFDAIGWVCLPGINNTHSADGLWRLFSYGPPSDEVHAATPANSSIVPHLSADPDHNFGLVLALTKHTDPSKFIVHVDTDCAASNQNEGKNISTFHSSPEPRLPYHIEYAEEYHFNPEHCGRFSRKPCWFDVGTRNRYEPGVVLVSPGAVPRSECQDGPSTTTVDAQDLGRRRSKLFELMSHGHAWHPDEVCPDYRLVCGSKKPPNLPRRLATCGPGGGKWIQAPLIWCEDSDVQGGCQGQISLESGRLPSSEDPTMSWYNFAEDSEVCTAPTLREAHYILKTFKHGDKICPGVRGWVPWFAPAWSSSSRGDEIRDDQRNPQMRWNLVRDLDLYQFGEQLNNTSKSQVGRKLMKPMSNENVFSSDKLRLRHRLPDTGSGATGSIGGRWIPEAALAAALAMTRVIPH